MLTRRRFFMALAASAAAAGARMPIGFPLDPIEETSEMAWIIPDYEALIKVWLDGRLLEPSSDYIYGSGPLDAVA